ncbi:MAG: type II toxin-antitoxin system prevent-host-death family antitoxin [bacterium]|nr:type II toxin-antitoxin system prevent-host-death family antitoxin [bacterium]
MTDALAADGTVDLSRPIGAADFKARCLQIMDLVRESGVEVTITKHNRPVAKLVPVQPPARRASIIGSCRDSLVIVDDDGDLSTAGEWAEWEAKLDRCPDAPAAP